MHAWENGMYEGIEPGSAYAYQCQLKMKNNNIGNLFMILYMIYERL